jgi:hypothetical protein
MRKLIIIVLLLANFKKNYAQNNAIFQGGNQDGATTTKITQTSNNIYLGGVNDGTSNQKYTQATNNIFVGNTGDGQSSIIYIQSANSIFAGGNSDGWAETNFLQAGNSIFAGGDADGWSETNFLQVGNSIFAGGDGDGWNAIYYKPIIALPVRLISFDVKKTFENYSQLNWETALEKNTAIFEIERGADALKFEKIGSLAAQGTSNEANRYDFLDTNPKAGINYYRLKIIDFDGKYEYSPARALNFEGQNSAIAKLYPNPTQGILNIDFAYENRLKPKIINIFNSLGVVVAHIKTTNNQKPSLILDLQQLPKGMYFANIIIDGKSTTQKIILN